MVQAKAERTECTCKQEKLLTSLVSIRFLVEEDPKAFARFKLNHGQIKVDDLLPAVKTVHAEQHTHLTKNLSIR